MSTATTTPGHAPVSPDRRHAVQTLHRLYLRLDGARYHTLPGKLSFAFRIATRPGRALVRACQGVSTYGREAKAATGMSLTRQFLHFWAVATRWGMTVEEYYRYRVFRTPGIADAGLVLCLHKHVILRQHLYDTLHIDDTRLADKRRFQADAAAAGLPVAAMVASFENGETTWWEPYGPESFPEGDLFAKPAASYGGDGAARWVREGEHYRGEDGSLLSRRSLINRLRESSNEAPQLLQRRLRPDPRLSTLSPGALATVRVVTSRPRGEKPHILLTIFRMPTANAPADNFAAGGIACMVETATGRLDVACEKSIIEVVRGTSYRSHPDTGAPIAGFVLPDWERVKTLCLAAHEVFGEFPSIGWDVALTDSGPVLLEGNYNWDIVLAQQPGPVALGTTDFPLDYLSYFAEREPAKA